MTFILKQSLFSSMFSATKSGRQLALFLLLFSSINLFGQILPPDFLCVTNDTLTWSPATNTCGPFNAFEIYGSTNEQGPYVLLQSETDPAETTFFHPDVNNQVWYYYLATNANCPGEITVFSDTLDNLIPIAGNIQSVSVVPGGVEINWDASPSPEVVAYVISRNTALGTTELDTVFGGLTTYLDTAADPNSISEVYYVVAIDLCGNKSLVVDPHATILLEVGTPDACQTGVAINWNPYLNWTEGVNRYEVFVSINNGVENLLEEVAANATSYTYMQANDGENLCFRVDAVENNTQTRSRSNISCTDVNIFQPIRNIELLGASVNPDGSVALEWFWDETALITHTELLSNQLGDDVVEVETILVNMPMTSLVEETATGQNAQLSSYIFNIAAMDNCDNQVTSNSSQTPFLTASIQGESSNLLLWEAYVHELASSIAYELVRVSGGIEEVIFAGTAFDTKYTDEINLNETENPENCYYLRVLVDYTLGDGAVLSRVLNSNTVCLVPAPKVYVPNVFAPTGANNEFRPFLSFNVSTGYNMDIFDRWGGHVFNSKDINNGWDGQRNGELMPQGVYLYSIEIRPEGGEPIKLSGDVLLLW